MRYPTRAYQCDPSSRQHSRSAEGGKEDHTHTTASPPLRNGRYQCRCRRRVDETREITGLDTGLSISVGRYAALQFPNPIPHHVDLCRGLRLVTRRSTSGNASRRRRRRSSVTTPDSGCTPLRRASEACRRKTRTRWSRPRHHLVAAAVEQLSPIAVPHWLGAAVRRDLPQGRKHCLRYPTLRTTRSGRNDGHNSRLKEPYNSPHRGRP
jgi:hypothetical protein